MLGIGITTHNRREVFNHTVEQVRRFAPADSRIIVVDDHSDNPAPGALYAKQPLGIAAAKTACLWHLQDCEYVVLLDDDICPLAEGWYDLLIAAHRASCIHHFTYVPAKDPSTVRPWDAHFVMMRRWDTAPAILDYNNTTGCLLFMTREAVTTVGAFGQYPGPYGFEHAGYSQRIWRAGLQNGAGPYCTVEGLADIMWSLDYDYAEASMNLPWGSSMPRDVIDASIKLNLPTFGMEQQSHVYRPLYNPL